jgi:hypothetical protein
MKPRQLFSDFCYALAPFSYKKSAAGPEEGRERGLNGGSLLARLISPSGRWHIVERVD